MISSTFLLFAMYQLAHSMSCNHDNLPTPELTKGNQNYMLPRRSSNFSPLRLVFDLRFLPNLTTLQLTTMQTLLSYVQNQVGMATKVIPISGNIFIPRCGEYWSFPPSLAGKCRSEATNKCGEVSQIPLDHLAPITLYDRFGNSRVLSGGTGAANADTLVYVTANSTLSCQPGVLAYATPCYLDQMDRPIVGNINFCIDAPFSGSISDQQKVALHEVLHVLGFSASLFSFYRDENGQPRTPRCPDAAGCTDQDPPGYPPYDPSTRRFAVSPSTVSAQGSLQYLVTPSVRAVAQAYYGCGSLPGAPLEDIGGASTAGSHWKERLLFAELMTGYYDSDFSESLSEFTLAALADSGWYSVDYSATDAAPPLVWARGEGCAPFAGACGAAAAAGSLCTVRHADGCTFDRSAVGVCLGLAPVLDSCSLNSPYSNYRCDNRTGGSAAPATCGGGGSCFGTFFGPGGACFGSNLTLGATGGPRTPKCMRTRTPAGF